MRHCEPFGWPCCASWNVWLVTAPTPASPVPPTLRRVAAIAHNGGRGHRSAPSQGHRPRLGVLALRRSPCTLAHSAAPCGWGLAHAYAPAYAHVQHAERLAGCCTCPTTEKTVCEPHSSPPTAADAQLRHARPAERTATNTHIPKDISVPGSSSRMCHLSLDSGSTDQHTQDGACLCPIHRAAILRCLPSAETSSRIRKKGMDLLSGGR